MLKFMCSNIYNARPLYKKFELYLFRGPQSHERPVVELRLLSIFVNYLRLGKPWKIYLLSKLVQHPQENTFPQTVFAFRLLLCLLLSERKSILESSSSTTKAPAAFVLTPPKEGSSRSITLFVAFLISSEEAFCIFITLAMLRTFLQLADRLCKIIGTDRANKNSSNIRIVI